jgi:hypothetical protein
MVDKYCLASIVWMDEAITTLTVEPTLDNSRSVTQFLQIIPPSLSWARAFLL